MKLCIGTIQLYFLITKDYMGAETSKTPTLINYGIYKSSGIVASAVTEAGGWLQVQGQPGLYIASLFQNNKKCVAR